MKLLFILLFLPFTLQAQVVSTSVAFATAEEEEGFDGGMITNGDFATADYWTVANNFAITGGAAAFTDGNYYGKLRQAETDMVSPINTSTNYRLEFDITIASGTARLYIMDFDEGVEYAGAADYANGHHVVDFTSPGYGSDGITIEANGNVGLSSFTIDNIKLNTR